MSWNSYTPKKEKKHFQSTFMQKSFVVMVILRTKEITWYLGVTAILLICESWQKQREVRNFTSAEDKILASVGAHVAQQV